MSSEIHENGDYSSAVGKRFGKLRRAGGRTRRDLSSATGISERYIGQLETGRANISLNLLHRLSGALGTTVTAVLDGDAIIHEPLRSLAASLSADQQREACDLLSATFSDGDMACKGIALVGLRGAGKSTLGNLLAAHAGVPFVRLSGHIADHAGMQINEIMELGGIDAFRRHEYEALEGLIGEPGRIVLETSGGMVAASETYDLLLANFRTVWLQADPDDHMNRVVAQNDLRPMAGWPDSMRELKGLLEERARDYGRADVALDTSGRQVDACLDELIAVSAPALGAS